MVDISGVRETESREIEAHASDPEALLIRWLTALLYHVDAEEMVFSRFEVTAMDETSLRARAYGERIDPERHDLGFAVKAVTRHMLAITRQDSSYRATVLFDI